VCAIVAGLVSEIVAGGHELPVLRAVHDVSSGGLSVALAEMAVAAGTGCSAAIDDPAELFTELPSRFVVATTMPDEVTARAARLGIPCSVLGRAGGDRFTLGDLVDLPLTALSEAHEGNLARLLGDS
jgi:phosphoribosylformylglycinamidine (FGAM) synthase-like enzyme